MINQGPRSDESRPIPSKRTHEQRQLVNNFRATLQKHFPIKSKTDVENLLLRFRDEVAKINGYISGVVEGHKLSGKILDRRQLQADVQQRYLEVLSRHDKEELHILLASVVTDYSIKNYI